jgi:hypothetical protein
MVCAVAHTFFVLGKICVERFLELITGFEPVTSSLPRTCSAT